MQFHQHQYLRHIHTQAHAHGHCPDPDTDPDPLFTAKTKTDYEMMIPYDTHHNHQHQHQHQQHPSQRHFHVASKTFGLILITVAFTWMSAVDVFTGTLFLGNPRKLMAQDPHYQQVALSTYTSMYTSTSNYTDQDQPSLSVSTPSLGKSVLLRGSSSNSNDNGNNHFNHNQLIEFNVTSSSGEEQEVIATNTHTTHNSSSSKTFRQTYHARIVYLQGDTQTWKKVKQEQQQTGRNYSIEVYPQMLALPLYTNQQQETPHTNNNTPTIDTLEDLTRFYPQIDSADTETNDDGENNSHTPSIFHIERRVWPQHEIDPQHCHPAAPQWQSTSFPVCNSIHEKDMLHEIIRNDMDMVSKKGFWRRAWGSYDNGYSFDDNKNNATTVHKRQKLVWKTFK
jgi:hypothetical protein